MRGNPTAKAGETNDAIHGWSAWNFKPGAFSGADKLDQPENGLHKGTEGCGNKGKVSVSVGVQARGEGGEGGRIVTRARVNTSTNYDMPGLPLG